MSGVSRTLPHRGAERPQASPAQPLALGAEVLSSHTPTLVAPAPPLHFVSFRVVSKSPDLNLPLLRPFGCVGPVLVSGHDPVGGQEDSGWTCLPRSALGHLGSLSSASPWSRITKTPLIKELKLDYFPRPLFLCEACREGNKCRLPDSGAAPEHGQTLYREPWHSSQTGRGKHCDTHLGHSILWWGRNAKRNP